MQGDRKEIRKKILDRIVGSGCTLVIHTTWEEDVLSLRVQGSLSSMLRISLFQRFKHKQLNLGLEVLFGELTMQEAFGLIPIIEVEGGLILMC